MRREVVRQFRRTYDAPGTWAIEITDSLGENWLAQYGVLCDGTCIEILHRGNEKIWSRRIKIGENLSETVKDHIEAS